MMGHASCTMCNVSMVIIIAVFTLLGLAAIIATRDIYRELRHRAKRRKKRS